MSRFERFDRGIALLPVLLVLVVLVLGAGAYVILGPGRGAVPDVVFDGDSDAFGRNSPLGLEVTDPAGRGLNSIRVRFVQAGEETVLVDEVFNDGAPVLGREYAVGELIRNTANPQPGAATIRVEANARGRYAFAPEGNVLAERELSVDLYPPEVQVISGLLYVNQGGSEAVVYRVSDDAVSSGVRVGENFFPGYRVTIGDDSAHLALFAFRYDLPTSAPVTVVASDAAGNDAVAGVSYRVTPREFRSREIAVDDAFLSKVVPEIVSRSPEVRDQGSMIDTYVEINSNLRRLNHERLTELSRGSAGEFLWDGGFVQLSNSQVESQFADRRTYLYNGEVVDQQDHVGFDLSVVERYPIEATNSGRVLLAEYFGIYGNTVLVDHGMGLVSLYGHLSSIDVEEGQMVEKGETLGRSGETGLAGGDHLHFGLFLHGVPVNPIEWWDARWVEEHVLAKLAR